MTYPEITSSRARLARACLEAYQAGIVAVEAERQKEIIARALSELGLGRQDKAREVLRELQPERNHDHH